MGYLGAGVVAALEVKEVDGSPDVSNVTVIRVSNGTLTNDGGGQVTIATGGGSFAGNSSSYQAFDIQSPPASAATQDDEFNGGPSVDGKWTQVNWSGLTTNNVNSTKPGSLYTENPSTSDILRCLLQAIPSGDFTIITLLWDTGQPNVSSSSGGLILADGTTAGAGNQVTLRINHSSSSGLTALATTWTNFNTFGSNLGPGTATTLKEEVPIIVKITRSGTTYAFAYSYDGRTFSEFHSGTLSFTPTHFGLFLNNSSGVSQNYSFDFFRYGASATSAFGNLVTFGGGLIVSAKASTPYSVLNSDINTVFTNEGATAQIVFNLPTAAVNLTYTFFVQDADGVKVVANTGDTIRLAGSVSASAGNIVNNTIGGSVTLVAINATEWVATSIVGTWTVT